MKDVFKEQLVKRRPDTKTTLAKVGLVLAALFLMVLALVLSMMVQALNLLLPILWVAIVFGAYFMFRRFNIEYEYVLTNYELDIDIIYGKSRRKRIFSTSVRDFEAFRRAGSVEMEHTFSAANAKADYSSGPGGSNTYEFLVAYKGKKMRIIFEPNEELLSSIIPFLKRGTYPAELAVRKTQN
ncbi:MAG: hypothetical protein FWC76_06445 [Defluviitaleaceae bacterium]|nr:hypothetical protein [Defluviitaleaceae bacterium]